MDIPKDARADAVLQTKAEADPEFADMMWRLRHPEKDGKKFTLVEVMAELQERHGIPVRSLSTVSSFYKWLSVRRDFERTRDVIEQIKEQMRADPTFDLEEIERAGVVMMAARGVQTRDGKLFSAMMKIGHGRAKIKQMDARLGLMEEAQELDKRRVALLEAKAAKADEAGKVMGDGKLTEEEKAAKLKQIFRMG
jgi:hypothetical protein